MSKSSVVQFEDSRKTVHNWLALDDLTPKPHPKHTRKVDKQVLKRHVQEYADAILSERVQLFGVSASAICYHLKQMKFSRKKLKIPRKHPHQERNISA